MYKRRNTHHADIGRFCRLPLHVIRTRVSTLAKMIWVEMALNCTPEKPRAWVRQGSMAKDMFVCTRTIRRGLFELEKANLIRHVGLHNGRYKVYELAWVAFDAQPELSANVDITKEFEAEGYYEEWAEIEKQEAEAKAKKINPPIPPFSKGELKPFSEGGSKTLNNEGNPPLEKGAGGFNHVPPPSRKIENPPLEKGAGGFNRVPPPPVEHPSFKQNTFHQPKENWVPPKRDRLEEEVFHWMDNYAAMYFSLYKALDGKDGRPAMHMAVRDALLSKPNRDRMERHEVKDMIDDWLIDANDEHRASWEKTHGTVMPVWKVKEKKEQPVDALELAQTITKLKNSDSAFASLLAKLVSQIAPEGA